MKEREIKGRLESPSEDGKHLNTCKQKAYNWMFQQKKVISFFFLWQFNRLEFFSNFVLSSCFLPKSPHHYILSKSFSKFNTCFHSNKTVLWLSSEFILKILSLTRLRALRKKSQISCKHVTVQVGGAPQHFLCQLSCISLWC